MKFGLKFGYEVEFEFNLEGFFLKMKIDSWRKILKIVTLHNIKEDKRVDLSFVALTSFDGKKKERGFDVD